ncbi:MAG TPA: AAA family ATPase [Candidatus Acidoferrum sp.]|nr:AAA family ATPase [Candidatus Acidoferrum sp.]
MSLYYITGATGTGKSTIRKALQTRGYSAHDVDEDDFAAFYNKKTGEAEDRPNDYALRTKEWYENHEWRLFPEAVEVLAQSAQGQEVFLCGIASNNEALRHYFDKVFCLTLDADTLTDRILTRTNNEFGKAPDELKNILSWHQSFEARNKASGSIMIDASQPVGKIVDYIVKTIKA